MKIDLPRSKQRRPQATDSKVPPSILHPKPQGQLSVVLRSTIRILAVLCTRTKVIIHRLSNSVQTCVTFQGISHNSSLKCRSFLRNRLTRHLLLPTSSLLRRIPGKLSSLQDLDTNWNSCSAQYDAFGFKRKRNVIGYSFV